MWLISLAFIISSKYHLGFWDPKAASLTLDCHRPRRLEIVQTLDGDSEGLFPPTNDKGEKASE